MLQEGAGRGTETKEKRKKYVSMGLETHSLL